MPTFDELLAQITDLLRRDGRLTYRSLKRRFGLDDEYVADLRDELIKAKRVAIDEQGEVLVWAGAAPVPSSSQPLAPSTQSPDAPRIEGERRQLTVMFIDLVGSTTLSQQLDPEDYHARVVAYQTACHQIIGRYEGHIAQYLGDGVLVYFGYPAAHEDDAGRAVHSGLEIVAAVNQLPYTPPLQIRIGLHTGPVVVAEIGTGAHTEQLALGETPNLAARIQGIAKPDEVVISAATYRLVEGLFEYEDRGQPELKGVSTLLTLYRVVKESEAQSRFQVVARKGLTPLVGREHEYGLLRERWDRAKRADGQVVMLSGEPGIGKSRLVEMLKEYVGQQGATRIEFRCSPYYQNSALYPVIDHLQRMLQFERDDTPVVKLAKLQRTLSRYRFPQRNTFPLLATLLSLPHPAGVPPLQMSPQKQKEQTLETLVKWLGEEADKQPVYCAWEDLHWADPSSLDVLSLLLDQVPTARLLVVLTFRPEFSSPWGTRSHLNHLTLTRLTPEQAAEIVHRVAGGQMLSPEVVRHVIAKTDGVPLFLEELTKAVVESGMTMGQAPLHTIPATLLDSLMARLDRLGPAKEILQWGATLGREFSYEVLQAVSNLDEVKLQQGLKHVVAAELVYQSGLPPQAHYLFKHALVQDAAYQSLLKSTRHYYHQRIAQVLEVQFPETTETQPELVAQHYTEAGLIAQAIPYWQWAGQRANERSANVEAISHLTKALELLTTLSDTPELVQQELVLQTTLGSVLMAAKGYAAPETGKVYTRARELCQQVGETPQLFPVLYGLWAFHLVRAELQTARKLAEQLLGLAESQQNTAFLVQACFALGVTLLALGELSAARKYLEQGSVVYDPQQHNANAFLYGHNPGMSCLSFGALTLWHLGYPDQALNRSQEGITLAQRASHPFSLAYALNFDTWLHQCNRTGGRQEIVAAAV